MNCPKCGSEKTNKDTICGAGDTPTICSENPCIVKRDEREYCQEGCAGWWCEKCENVWEE
jgi:hypothetical protein